MTFQPDAPQPSPAPLRVPLSPRRWFGRGGFIAIAVFVLGRLALEPARSLPQFDAKGMEAFDSVETYLLRKNPPSFEMALLGSSVSQWDVTAEIFAEGLGIPQQQFRKLATPGGTPFDMWNIVRQNPERFAGVKEVLVEVNPFIFRSNLDDDPRLRYTISKHAELWERRLLSSRWERTVQTAEWFLPVDSVRRSLRTAILNITPPEPDSRIFPSPDNRAYPTAAWHADYSKRERPATAKRIAHQTARRLVSSWAVSKLQDHSMRSLLTWMDERSIRVWIYQPPVTPLVAAEIQGIPYLAKGYRKFSTYLDSLRRPAESWVRVLSSDECGVPADAFRDTTHLNRRGAEIFSRYLAGELKKRGAMGTALPLTP